jgi:ferritin-like protein
MKRTKLQRLLKSYEVETIGGYFWVIVESVINGNREQAREQFKEMQQEQRKEFLIFLCVGNYTTLSDRDKEMFIKII